MTIRGCGHVRLIYSDRVTGYLFHWLNAHRPTGRRTGIRSAV